jgi:hypothetical protein
MSNELAIHTKTQDWELMQRQAKASSLCTFIPEAFKGNVTNCLLAVELAEKMGLHWLTVMNSLHSIHGKFGWSAKFMIGRVNISGKYASDIRYEEGGEGDDQFCCAWVWEKTSENEKARKLVGTRVTIAMAKKEGWFGKSGSKWQTMPDQMLRYRAATFFCNTHAPELLMALPMSDELVDMKPAQAKVIQPDFSTTSEAAPEPSSGGFPLEGQDMIDDE